MRRLPRPASWWGGRFACQSGPLRLVNKQPRHLARTAPLKTRAKLLILRDRTILGHVTAAGGPFRARIGRREGEVSMVWSAGAWIPFDAGVRARWRMAALLCVAGFLCAQTPAEPRAARSVHLRYQGPQSTAFYNELTVEESVQIGR